MEVQESERSATSATNGKAPAGPPEARRLNTEPRWDEARELFLDLAELEPEQRERELAQLAADEPQLAEWVQRLFEHDSGPLPDAALPAEAPAPQVFGPYEVVRPIGQGGMGDVFVARRADGEYEQEVAVKLLRGAGNTELVARFQRERQALASLDHEYIARLLDGGTSERGEPYLVMEYVEGEHADVFAARLGLRERLELFVRIGQAVAHAHSRGFVHRDLKPGNILVRPDGQPRLLDFGIAKLDGNSAEEGRSLTRTGERLFTPEYASPEQIRGENATAESDIFALGVLLYVFLCGERPWERCKTLRALEWAILEADPRPPSRRLKGTGRGRIAGDLDAIVLHCLAKRPERRYGSVAALCADLENYLAGRPILARRTGIVGRAVRFARRRPVYPVAIGLSALALFALWFAWDSQRRDLRRRDDLRQAVSDRIETARVLATDGNLADARAELAAAEEALLELPNETGLLARALVEGASLANTDRDWDRTISLVARAEPLATTLDPPDHRLFATLFNVHAYAVFRHDGSTEQDGRDATQHALDYARDHLAEDDPLRIDAVLGWVDQLRREGDALAAIASIDEALRLTRARNPRSEDICRLLNERGVVLAESGRLDEAAACYEEALELLAWHRGERHASFAKLRMNHGATLFRMGRLEEAREAYALCLIACRELGDDLFISSCQHFLGRIDCLLGDYERAEPAAREALEIRERISLDIHTERSRCLLGIILARSERLEQALEILEPLVESAPPGLFLEDMEAEAYHMLGACLQDLGDGETALPHLERALAAKRRNLGPDHEDCLDLEGRIAVLH